jgi:hypothetical protein
VKYLLSCSEAEYKMGHLLFANPVTMVTMLHYCPSRRIEEKSHKRVTAQHSRLGGSKSAQGSAATTKSTKTPSANTTNGSKRTGRHSAGPTSVSLKG